MALGIALGQPERLGDAFEEIADVRPTAVVVCAYGALVREPLLSAYEILNVHPSRLPRWRGAAPIERAIMAGDTQTGVSIIRLTAGLDSGPICAQEAEAVGPEDTYGTLARRLATLSARLLIGALDGPREYVEQSEEGVTYAEKITPEDRVLNPDRTPAELVRIVRALDPHIGARIETPILTGGLRVLAAREIAGDGGSGRAGDGESGRAGVSVDEAGPPPAGRELPPAGALGVDGGRLYYGARGGAVELVRVQPPGGRPMDGADYARGHAV